MRKIKEAYDLYVKENSDANLKKYEKQKEKLIEIKTKGVKYKRWKNME
jgi:hypothetical protein